MHNKCSWILGKTVWSRFGGEQGAQGESVVDQLRRAAEAVMDAGREP